MTIPAQRKKVYYAHSVSLYGTRQEFRDIWTLEHLGLEVINPNTPECTKGYQEHGMAYFDELLLSCEIIAFRANTGGSINAGVGKEIEFMRKRGRSVIELPTFVARQVLSVEDTRAYLSEVGNR